MQYYHNISLTPLIAPKYQTSSFFYAEASTPAQHAFMSLAEATTSFSNVKSKIRCDIPCQRLSKGGLPACFLTTNGGLKFNELFFWKHAQFFT